MKKLSSPWRSHCRIVEMITPVTALIRNQKSGAYKTVHVNNLRYANINDRWDLKDFTDEENTREFPEQNTRKRILPRRQQPDRRVQNIQNTVRWKTCGMMKIHQRIQLMKKSLRSKKNKLYSCL